MICIGLQTFEISFLAKIAVPPCTWSERQNLLINLKLLIHNEVIFSSQSQCSLKQRKLGSNLLTHSSIKSTLFPRHCMFVWKMLQVSSIWQPFLPLSKLVLMDRLVSSLSSSIFHPSSTLAFSSLDVAEIVWGIKNSPYY